MNEFIFTSYLYHQDIDVVWGINGRTYGSLEEFIAINKLNETTIYIPLFNG